MFLPWPFFVVKLILSIFHLLLVGSLGAILSIYSRFGDDYANSLRWIRTGGYLEMVVSLYNSAKSLRLSTKVALLSVIIASLVTDLADDGASFFITPAQQEVNHSIHITNITHVDFYDDTNPFLLTAAMFQGDDPNTVVMSLLNNTNVIPGAIKGKFYKPQQTGYVPKCTTINIDNIFRDDVLPTGDPCSSLGFKIKGSLNYSGEASVVQTQNTVRLIVPIEDVMSKGLDVTASMVTNHTLTNPVSCTIDHWERALGNPECTGEFSRLQSVVTRCVTSHGKIMVIAMTVSCIKYYNRSGYQPVQPDANDSLFNNMEQLFKDRRRTGTIYAAEARVNGTDVESLACYGAVYNGDNGNYRLFQCIYINIATILIEIKNEDPPPIDEWVMYGRALINILHSAKWSTNGRILNASELKTTTLALRDTFASLASNIILSEDGGIVVYDTFDIRQGFEIPAWLAVLVVAFMVVSAIIWGLTLFLLDERLTSSLYKLLSLEIVPHAAPVPMRAKLNPIEIEGHPIVNNEEKHQLQDCTPDSVRSSLDALTR